MMCMSATLAGILEVVLKHGTVVGVCHLDEFLGLLHIALVTEVSNTVLSDDGIDEVIGVVDMTGEGYDAGDGAALGSRTAGEDREVSRCGEVG